MPERSMSPYFKFPLALLALPKPYCELVRIIAAYCAAYVAVHRKVGTVGARGARTGAPDFFTIPRDCPELHVPGIVRRVSAAREWLSLPPTALDAQLLDYQCAAIFASKWARVDVTIPSRIFHEALDMRMEFPTFQVYCGALSLRTRPMKSRCAVTGMEWGVSVADLAVRASGQFRAAGIPGVEPMKRSAVKKEMARLEGEWGILEFRATGQQTVARFLSHTELPVAAEIPEDLEEEVLQFPARSEGKEAEALPLPAKRDGKKPKANAGCSQLARKRAAALRKAPEGVEELEAAFRQGLVKKYGEEVGNGSLEWGASEIQKAGELVEAFGVEKVMEMIDVFLRKYEEYRLQPYPTIHQLSWKKDRLYWLVSDCDSRAKARVKPGDFNPEGLDECPKLGW